MSRLLVIGRVLVAAALAAGFAVGDAVASHPDILRNYRFIPSHSTLVVNGSSWGHFEETFHARGTFGLVTGFEEGVTCMAIGCPPPPTHVPYAEFVDVNAWLIPDGPLAYVLDLDRTLNLSGLDGTFHSNTADHLSFRGEDGQGRPFHLEATIHGRLLHLVGESGPGCCDVNHYMFNALAYLTPHADANLDGNVDAADYVALRKSLSQVAAGTEDGALAAADVDIWRTQFGDTLDFSQFAAAEAGSAAVPEPASALLLLLGAVCVSLHGRIRKK